MNLVPCNFPTDFETGTREEVIEKFVETLDYLAMCEKKRANLGKYFQGSEKGD